MLVNNKSRGIYTKRKKYVVGAGFVDVLKDVGNYLSANKDLIAKPILGAVGALAATGLTAGSQMLIKHLSKKKKKAFETGPSLPDLELDDKSKEIIQNMLQSSQVPTTNIIGSGIKNF